MTKKKGSSKNFLLVEQALQAYPLVWFDNMTMAMMLEIERRIISRARIILREKGMIEEKKSYFKLKVKSII